MGGYDKNGHQRYWCRCDCGKRRLIRGDYLQNGRISSCGHYKRGEPVFETVEGYKCIETGEIFANASEAMEYAGIDKKGVLSFVKKASSSTKNEAGTHPETGEPLHWCRAPALREVTRRRVRDRRYASPGSIMVVLANTGEVFNSMREASDAYPQASIDAISRCCSGERKSAGKNRLGDPLVWVYYDDWIGKGVAE